jgi:EmrB/QacA subfamily drug resistance transporter
MSDPVATNVPDPRRWFALFVIAIAQLMVVLDASIINIALPHAQHALHISDQNRQWAVTAYTLTFGGFLLLGGRVGDYLGRKRAFLIGLLGFAGASLIGGFSVDQQMLFGARALQGVFGALLAPAALSLISVTFTDSKERAKAFAVYGALAGVGSAIGLIAGGILTQYFSWRWCLFVNTPMALLAFTLAVPNVRESKVHGHPKYDVPGALTATAGMVSTVFGVSEAATNGWTSTSAWPFIVIGAVLLTIFFVIESRVASPLLPLRLITERVRAGAYLTQLFVGLGLFGMFLFLTFYFQDVHGFSPIKAGLCFLPFSVGIIIAAAATSQLLPKIGPRWLATTGCAMASLGLFYLSTIHATSSYVAHVMPAMIVISLGLGMAFVALASTALFNVQPRDTGAASAVLTTSQQVGGSFGTAIQNTISVSAGSAIVLGWAAAHQPHTIQQINDQLVHGYDLGFRFGGLMMLLGAITFGSLVNVDRHHLGQNDESVAVH